jgi:hypothetical protein
MKELELLGFMVYNIQSTLLLQHHYDQFSEKEKNFKLPQTHSKMNPFTI